MSLPERQMQMIEELSVIPDATERFSWLVDRTKKMPPLPDEERIEAFYVEGCQSDLWIVPDQSNAPALEFRAWSDAPIVRAMADLLCRLYSGADPTEITDFDPTILEDLQLTTHLTPNRREGMRRIIAKIRHYADADAAKS